jgi:hypothetical protein
MLARACGIVVGLSTEGETVVVATR